VNFTSLGISDIPWPERSAGSTPESLSSLIRKGLDPLIFSPNVTPESAMQLAAVVACTRILSTAVASLPLHTLQLDNDTWQKAPSHYLYGFFDGRVNPYTTAYMWKQHLVTSLCLYGNAYSHIVFNRRMQVMGLYSLDSTRMKVTLQNGQIEYKYRNQNQLETVIPADEILHVRWLSTDGIVGRSPIQAGCDAIGLGLATQQHTLNFFGNGATVGPVIKVPGAYDSEKSKQFEEAFSARHQGNAKSHTPLFLYAGMEMAQQNLNFEQLQMIQLKQFSVTDVARLYGVPSHMLNQSEPGMSKANVEQQALEFSTNTLKPIIDNLEAELNSTLLSDRERLTVRCQFDLDSYTRVDFAARTTGYKNATGGTAWLTPNEVRAKENLPPIDGGDKLYITPGASSAQPDTTPTSEVTA